MAKNDAPAPPPEPAPASTSRRLLPPALLLALVTAAVAFFVVQNPDTTTVSFVTYEGEGPLWSVITASAVGGAVIAMTARWMVGRRR